MCLLEEYPAMLSKEDNELLTQTGPGTPMGDLLRRYWVPAFLSEDFLPPTARPVQIRLMGEGARSPSAIRTAASVSWMSTAPIAAPPCSTGGTRSAGCAASTTVGSTTWTADVLDTPAEPAGSRFKEKLHQTAYPCQEAAGIVFAYMGPKDKMPLFPNYEFRHAAPCTMRVTKSLQDCNYLQGVEGECDTTHLQYLHWQFEASGHMRDYYRNPMREYITEETDFGVRLVALRDAGPDQTYVRVSSIVMPMLCWIPAGGTGSVHMYIPAQDDAHSWRFNLDLNVMRDRGEQEKFWDDESYRKVRNIKNHYLQDRELQKDLNFTGMGPNFVIHDSCATETMGPIYDRSKEHLGASDKAVIAMRNLPDSDSARVRGRRRAAEPRTGPEPGHPRPHRHVLEGHRRAATGAATFPHLTMKREAGLVGRRFRPLGPIVHMASSRPSRPRLWGASRARWLGARDRNDIVFNWRVTRLREAQDDATALISARAGADSASTSSPTASSAARASSITSSPRSTASTWSTEAPRRSAARRATAREFPASSGKVQRRAADHGGGRSVRSRAHESAAEDGGARAHSR